MRMRKRIRFLRNFKRKIKFIRLLLGHSIFSLDKSQICKLLFFISFTHIQSKGERMKRSPNRVYEVWGNGLQYFCDWTGRFQDMATFNYISETAQPITKIVQLIPPNLIYSIWWTFLGRCFPIFGVEFIFIPSSLHCIRVKEQKIIILNERSFVYSYWQTAKI